MRCEVFNLRKPGVEMSTHDYLNGLTLEQLIYARDRADAMIKAKQAEKKRVVWCIEDDGVRLHFFPADRYVEAAETLLAEAKKNEAAGKSASEKALSLLPEYVRESEYALYETEFPPAKGKGEK